MARARRKSSQREAAPAAPSTAAVSRSPRTVRLSAYYDAAAVNREQDFGIRSSHFEDAHFGTGTRNRVLARFRREVRNNPYLAGLVSKYPEAIGTTSLRSRTSSRPYNESKDGFWFRWSKRVTLDGESLRTVEKLLGQELLIAGELFVVLVANGRIQPISSEFCGSPSDPKKAAKGEINGVVYAANGRPAAYRFGKLDESGTLQITGDPGELVDARYVIHVYDRDRVQMGRGLPWLLPSLRTARDLYEITRAKTKQIKDANSITGVIEKAGAADWLAGMGAPPSDALNANGIGENLDAPADRSSSANATAPVIDLATGTLVALEPGEKVNNLMPEYHAEDYKDLIMLMLHAIATPVGLPVELWFSGLGEVNFSGFKGLGAQWDARRRHVIAFLEDKLFNRLQFWRISKAQKEGDLPANPDGDEDLVEWGWKRSRVLDEERAAKANQIRLDTGEACLADVWEENGFFTEEVLAGRRNLYIKALVAAGEIDEGGDHAEVKVPLDFLLRGELAAKPQETRDRRQGTGDSGQQTEEEKPEIAARRTVDWIPSDNL